MKNISESPLLDLAHEGVRPSFSPLTTESRTGELNETYFNKKMGEP